jgi:hypothetical protein
MKALPLIVTTVPTGPIAGVNDEIVGAGCGGGGFVTVKLDPLVAVPPEVVTVIKPLVAPDGTVAVICVSESTVNKADVPLNVTEVAPVKAVPVIVTDVPTSPIVGVNNEIVGAGAGALVHPGSWKEPIRVFQLSWASVVGCVS